MSHTPLLIYDPNETTGMEQFIDSFWFLRFVSYTVCRHFKWVPSHVTSTGVMKVPPSSWIHLRHTSFPLRLHLLFRYFQYPPPDLFKALLTELANHFAKMPFPGFVRWRLCLLRQSSLLKEGPVVRNSKAKSQRYFI